MNFLVIVRSITFVQTCDRSRQTGSRRKDGEDETNGIHEILGMGSDDENVVVRGEVSFKPDDGFEIQVIGRLVEQEEMRSNRQRLGQRNSHSPSSRHVLRRLAHHLRSESETVQNGSRLSFERRGVEFLEFFVLQFESQIVDDVGHGHVLNLLLDSGRLVSGGLHNVVEGGNVGRLDFSLNEVNLQNVDMSPAFLFVRGE